MKSYLDLVSVSRRIHKKKNRMSVFCIVLSVFLVSVIFGMADMFIQSQLLQAEKEGGKWHIAITEITDKEVTLISARPEVSSSARYGILNFRGDQGYFLSGKNAMLVGCDESFMTDISDNVSEGRFPQSDGEAMVTKAAKSRLGFQIGDKLSIDTPEGVLKYTICGFSENAIKTLEDDSYAVFLTTDAFRAVFSDKKSDELEDYDSLLYVQFSEHSNIRRTITDMKEQLGLSGEQVIENTKLLGLTGQSRNAFMMQIYGTAVILFVIVMTAGILMIAGSIGSDVAQRTEFFGMVRCIGATPKQIMKLVRKEAMSWCRLAIPCGIAAGMCVIWVLCGVLRFLSPAYFGELPVFRVSLPGILSGIFVGIFTVFFAAHTPAKRASRVSPLTAVQGNANRIASVKRAANTGRLKVETALGIHHAASGKKNFLLMVGSFGISIILFLTFSLTVDFMHHALKPLDKTAPDLVVASEYKTHPIDHELIKKLKNHTAVKAMYGLVNEDEPVPAEETADYTMIHVQLLSGVGDEEVDEIYEMVGDEYMFSDERMSNQSVRGAYYSFALCVYGFLVLIAFITVLNIVNSIDMSVTARIKEYGAFRAIGISHRQLGKMVLTEACTYAFTGCVFGCVLGIMLHRLMFYKLIGFYWKDTWQMPYREMLVILTVVTGSVLLAVRKPLKRIRELSIVDTIHAQ